MKYFLISLICGTIIYGCRKEAEPVAEHFRTQERLREILEPRVEPSILATIDFSRAVESPLPDSTKIFRIPFYGSDLIEDFIIVQADEQMGFIQGARVDLNGAITNSQFTGSVKSESLQGVENFNLAIQNGQFITNEVRFSPDSIYAQGSMADPVYTLPEVVIISTISHGNYSQSAWINLVAFFNTSNPGTTSGVFGYAGGGGGSSGNNHPPYPATGNPGNGFIFVEEPIVIDFEDQYDEPAINLEQYLNCFAQVPDAGATASIEILTDIPVDGDPTKLFDWRNGSPGHTFLQLRKETASQSVSQNIGFYPQTGWKSTLTSAPLDSKFVDNQGHEFNAAYKVTLTLAELNMALNSIRTNANQRYSIDNYNCTTWALQIFNGSVPPSKALTIPLYTLPGSTSSSGSMTPQGVICETKSNGSCRRSVSKWNIYPNSWYSWE